MRNDLFPNKCPPREYLKNIYVDSHTADEDFLMMLVKTLGSDHIVIGSDYPFPLGELEPGKMVEESKQLTEEMKK
jgi:aminocarboxymuconate-semialdehyde decarboxylase